VGSRSRPRLPVALLLAAAILLLPTQAAADVGLPMLVVAWPAMAMLFVPVCVIEAVVARRLLGGNFWHSSRAVVVANILSTAVGVPLSWAVLVIAATVLGGLVSVLPGGFDSPLRWVLAPFFVAWLGPGVERHAWWIPLAFLGLQLPFFAVSVWLERRIVAWFGRWPREAVARWSWEANILSYSLIVAIAGGVTLWARYWPGQ
jgi:hypothetical protein